MRRVGSDYLRRICPNSAMMRPSRDEDPDDYLLCLYRIAWSPTPFADALPIARQNANRGPWRIIELPPDGTRFSVITRPPRQEAAAGKNDKFVLRGNAFDELRRTALHRAAPPSNK